MNSSLYNSVSGVKSFQFAMDVQSNNIANINTIGFKGSTPEISSLFSTTLAGTYAAYANDDSLGASSQTTAFNMNQGILQNTDNAFDLAIGGEGWFGVQGLNEKTYFTRAGQFSIDSNGDLVDINGNYLLATSGNNITPTTLDETTLSKFGTYYKSTAKTPAQPYAISATGDVPLGSVGKQTKVHLPDLLYYPPTATTNVSYSASLNPKITTGSVSVPLNSDDYTQTVTAASGKISLNGTTTHTSALQNPQPGDQVLITVTDNAGKKLTTTTQLDASNQWNISNVNVSELDTSSPLNVSVSVTSNQEVANQDHASIGIIGPDGDKDTLDMTFTKRVPQAASGTTWDVTANIYSFYENYDSTKTYDPSLYYVNQKDAKVYEIVDTQTGVLEFDGAGRLLSNSLPALSNGGTTLNVNLGTLNSFDGLVSSTSITKTSSYQTNGTVEGFLKNYGMDGNGNIIAEFDNGKSSAIAKVAVYHFQNDQGLTSASSNLFEESSNSGKAIFYTDKDGNAFLGSNVLNHRLEGSNVSMATALTELIVIQKAFTASSKGITTSDELLQNAINMKQ